MHYEFNNMLKGGGGGFPGIINWEGSFRQCPALIFRLPFFPYYANGDSMSEGHPASF